MDSGLKSLLFHLCDSVVSLNVLESKSDSHVKTVLQNLNNMSVKDFATTADIPQTDMYID